MMRYVFSLPPTYIFVVTLSLERLPTKGKDLSLVMRQLVKTHRTPTRYLRTSELKKSYHHYYYYHYYYHCCCYYYYYYYY